MILGIDEVGRGPWAGPLVIGAVILKDPTAPWCAALTDSKKLTEKRREALADEIYKKAAATAIGWVTSGELDLNGLRASLNLATRRAVNLILSKKVPFTEIIIDGTLNFLANTPLENHVTTLKKADLLIKEVSAASIIAKVARDQYMKDLAAIYPDYGFDSHVGYGTAKHKQALETLGPCPEHRYSFKPVAAFATRAVEFSMYGATKEAPSRSAFSYEKRGATSPATAGARSVPVWGQATTREEGESVARPFSEEYKRSAAREKCPQGHFSRRVTLEEKGCAIDSPSLLMEPASTTTSKGQKAESVVADYLKQKGHRIIARNHKTRFYEIDIISTNLDSIYFTEVKYRSNKSQVNPLETITKKKQKQMTYAAESFLRYRRDLAHLNPKLAAAAVSGTNYHLDTWFPL